MEITQVPFHALTPQQVTCWSRLQLGNPDLASPFFCPEYTQAVAAVRDDVGVGILQEAGRTVGFFPFQRAGALMAEAVGSYMSDYQGIVTEHGLRYEMEEVLRGCRLAIWDFESVPSAQEAVAPFSRVKRESPVMDLSRGYGAYLADQDPSSTLITTLMRKSRKIEREVGPLRFVTHLSDISALGLLIQMKIDQYRRTGAADVFGSPWTRRLVETIFAAQSATFAGILSALYAGDRVVAMHFGIRSSRIWHYWFPVYDLRYAAYSPGLLLLLKMAESAESLGLQAIDLGHTDRLTYKNRFMNGSVPMCAGTVELRPWSTVARQLHRHVRPAAAALRRLVPGRRHRPTESPGS